MAVGKNLLSKPINNCIAVIGDGAITGGMAYEAMNNAAYINTRIVVILNDNGQVPPYLPSQSINLITILRNETPISLLK